MPPSPRAAEAAKEQALRAGAEAPAARQSTEEAARATEAYGSAAVATPAATTAPIEPLRKKKRGFSTLR
jgi:hypothetical protein